MPADAPKPVCANCRNFEASDDGRWYVPKWLVTAMIAAGVTVSLAAGGWVWFLSGQAAQAKASDDRITKIEQHDDDRDKAIVDMKVALGRIETTLKIVVDHLK